MIINTWGVEPLNYAVIGGTTKPTSVTANTIWVNTSTAISSYVFSISAPSSPTTGMVWFRTNIASSATFNALTFNKIEVCPTGCHQYVSGAWAARDAQIYTGSAWLNMMAYLYNSGNECTSLTGGWVGKALLLKATNGGVATAPTITRGTSNIQCLSKANYGAAIFYTSKKINLAGYNTLRVQGSSTNPGDGARTFAVWSSIGSNSNENRVAYATLSNSFDLSLNVKSLTSTYYIGFQCVAGLSSNCNITMTKCWLEI